MNAALTFVNNMKAKISDDKLKSDLQEGLIECFKNLNEMADANSIYALGFYCGNPEFPYVVFTANTLSGLEESFRVIDSDESEENPEATKYFIRWNSADWKYHNFLRPQTLIEASKIFGEINDSIYEIGSCNEPEHQFTKLQLKDIKNGKKTYEIDPNITYYDFERDVYYPILEDLYGVLINVLANVKKEMNLSDNIFLGLFAGDAPYDFMIQHGAKLNSKATLKKAISDIEKYGELIGYEMFDEDYRKYLK